MISSNIFATKFNYETVINQLKNETEFLQMNCRTWPFASRTGKAINRGSSFEVTVPTFRATLAKRGIAAVKKVGDGCFSKVYLCYRPLTRNNAYMVEAIAVKVINRAKTTTDYQNNFITREITNWKSLSHPNLVRMYDCFLDPLNRFTFMQCEFCAGGDCLQFIRHTGALDEPTARNWMRQITSAVGYMHSLDIAHRDLKLENIFLDSLGNVKVGDFGFSTLSPGNQLSQTFCGSKAYAAPEIIMGQIYDAKKADIWAIGVITFIFLIGKMPFNEHKFNSHILEDQRMFHVPIVDCFAPIECTNFINFTLKFEFHSRPSIRELLEHDWLHAYSRVTTPGPPNSPQPITISNSSSKEKAELENVSKLSKLLNNVNNQF